MLTRAAVLLAGTLYLAPTILAQTIPPSFDLSALDPTTPACQNFYQYSCGGWLKNNPIPPDQSRWGRFNELAERNRLILKDLLETAVAKPTPSNRKTGDYYAACMDEKGIALQGLTPLQPTLQRIEGITSKDDLPALLAYLHPMGVNAFFRFGSTQDAKDANSVIAETNQGGLGLPDRDYYLKTDVKSLELRTAYLAHVAKMLELAGDTPAQAAEAAKTIVAIETVLAEASLDRVSRRDPNKQYHKFDRTQLTNMTPAFNWNRYLSDLDLAGIKAINVGWPDFFQQFNILLLGRDLADLKTYLRWQYIRSSASLLPQPFVDESFNFYGKTLTGAKALPVRWKRCVQATDGALGEALGRLYVDKTFGKDGKRRMLQLIQNLENALEADINSLDWMTPATKKEALIKLKAITNKIGYPDRWRDYSKLVVNPQQALANRGRSNAFEFKRDLDKIGKPVDQSEWFLSPPTVNAYYDPQNNNINFPAGILQPPFFDRKIDDAVNYGGIGAVIGHELTHGFDDQGRQFDAKGNLRDWWTPKDASAFSERTSCLVNQYSSYQPLADVQVNGKLTLGENTADNGGLRIAYMALLETLGKKPTRLIDGFTPQQRLFIGWGQVWCTNATDEAKRLQVLTDPHSPGEYRVNGVVSNMPEFQAAFNCKKDDPMVREAMCRVW